MWINPDHQRLNRVIVDRNAFEPTDAVDLLIDHLGAVLLALLLDHAPLTSSKLRMRSPCLPTSRIT